MRSIKWELTLHYIASTVALLLLAAGFLYWTLKWNLEATRHAMLVSKVEVFRLLLRDHPEKPEVLASEVEHEASASQPLRYFIRILDQQHRILLQTSGMKDLLPVEWFPAPIEATPQVLHPIRRHLRTHGAFILLSVQVPLGVAGQEKGVLQIGMDTSTGDHLLIDYKRKLLLMLGLGLVFAAVAGVWIAHKGMRPLVDITQAAQHITASQLHERIAHAQWPSELAELAAAFDAMLDRLQDSFNRLSQFSADLAHELRTPINNLRGEAEVALARARSVAEYQHILISSLEEYDRLSRMIDGLLFLARTDNPKAAVEKVRFDARKEIEAVRDFYEALAGEQEVEVICEGSALLTGEPLLFRRAVSNLLANALRHTPSQGKVTLSLKGSPNGTVELYVRDTGSGIAAEHLPKIFDRFYRVGHSRSQVPGGMGLGLAMVQSIMRLHGGTASVQSTVGQGTTVALRFPA